MREVSNGINHSLATQDIEERMERRSALVRYATWVVWWWYGAWSVFVGVY